MAATFISVPQKNSTEVDLTRPFKTFIANTYGTEAGGEDYSHAIKEFNKLRTNACVKVLDKHETAVDLVYRYYDQLVAIEAKLPIAEDQIRVAFCWYDAFNKGSWFGGQKKQSMTSSSFEKACVLFNIAALHSQIAGVQNLDTDVGLKQAANHFKIAAGIFSHLKDHVYTYINHIKTYDMEPSMLTFLAAIMVAQAQEVFFKKAVTDKMKSAIIAKIAAQASDLYGEAMHLSQEIASKEIVNKEWFSILAAKTPYFLGEAEYHQSVVCKESKGFGEQIARLQHASELIEAAHNRGGLILSYKDTAGKIKRNFDDAKKDNDFIYHEKVPERGRLSAIGRASLAKPVPLNSPMSSKFTDLFENLVPLVVHQSLTSFDGRKAEIVNREIGKLRSKTELMNSVLTTFNLPAAVEDVSGTAVPPSVLEKAQAIQSEGGLQKLDQMINEMPELLTRNKEVLDEAIRMLDEEQRSDEQMRSQFKERWTRLPSEKLTAPLRTEAVKYKGILDSAIQADHVVKEKYGTHKEAIVLLSKSEAELAGAIPSAGPTATAQGSAVVTELRKLLEQVHTIKAERDTIEQDLQDATVDMKSQFMSSLAASGAIDEETISNQQLDQIYGQLIDQVNDNIERQDTLLANIERANYQFCEEKQSNAGAVKREEVLRKLAAAHNAYMELLNNLREGTKFYNDLTPLLVRYQSKVSDLVFARKTEKEELMKDLQQNIVNQPTGPAPVAPTHHGGQSQAASRQPPPPRPPPPAAASTQPPQQPPATAPPAYAPAYGSQPYPYPGYTPPPMPGGYNPYAQMTYPPQQQQQQQQQQQPYPGQPQYGNPPYPAQAYGNQPYPAQPQYPYPRQ